MSQANLFFFLFFLVVILSLANIELIKVTKDYCSLREREREREREKERGDKGEWSSRGRERWRRVSGKEGSVEENQALRNSRGPTCLAGRHVVYTLLLYMGPYSPTHTVVRVILSLHAPTPSSSQSFELLPSPSPFYHTLAHYPTPTLLHSSLLSLNYNIFLDQLLSIF